MTIIIAAIVAGCAQSPSAQSGQGGAGISTFQTVVLKTPAFAKISHSWDTDSYYRITAVTGTSRTNLSVAQGELWLVSSRAAGFMSRELDAVRWEELGQIRHTTRMDGRTRVDIYSLATRKDLAAKVKTMAAYEQASFYVCEQGANPKQSLAACMPAKNITASMFHGSETAKPNDKSHSYEMRMFLDQLVDSETVHLLSAETYTARREKWLMAYEKSQSEIVDRKKRIAEEASRQTQAARNFLTKSKKGTDDSCRSTVLLANGEPTNSATSFECQGSHWVSLGELQGNGWAVTSTIRESFTNTTGAMGNVVMITVKKSR